MKQWYVYITECRDGSLYTGITIDLSARLKRHSSGRGSKYVTSKGLGQVVYIEPRADRASAQRREHEIKSWSRTKKLAFIKTSSIPVDAC